METPESSPVPVPVSADKLASELAAEMPPVSPGVAIDGQNLLFPSAGESGQQPTGGGPQNPPPATGPGLGLNKDGTPRQKPGRKPKSAASNVVLPRRDAKGHFLKPGAETPASAAAAAPQHAPGFDPHLAPAIVTANLVFMVGRIAGGEEWAPMIDKDLGLDEPAMMRDAWRDYYKSKGIQDVPPGVALSLTMVAYAAQRMTKPITLSRMARAKNWLAAKYLGWKARRGGVKSNGDIGDPANYKPHTATA